MSVIAATKAYRQGFRDTSVGTLWTDIVGFNPKALRLITSIRKANKVVRRNEPVNSPYSPSNSAILSAKHHTTGPARADKHLQRAQVFCSVAILGASGASLPPYAEPIIRLKLRCRTISSVTSPCWLLFAGSSTGHCLRMLTNDGFLSSPHELIDAVIMAEMTPNLKNLTRTTPPLRRAGVCPAAVSRFCKPWT